MANSNLFESPEGTELGRFEVTITPAYLRREAFAMLIQKLRAAPGVPTSFGLLLLVFVAALALVVFGTPDLRPLGLFSAAVTFALAAGLSLCGFVRLWRELSPHVTVGKVLSGTVTRAGIRIERAHGHTEFVWSDYTRVRKLCGFVMLIDQRAYDEVAYISSELLPDEVLGAVWLGLRKLE